MLSNHFFILLNQIYGTNVIVASFKLLNYSESGARQLLNKPLSEFNPAKFIQKITKKNPNKDSLIFEKWKILLEDFISGIDDPDKYCNDFFSFFKTAAPDIPIHPKYTIGCLAHSDASLSKFLQTDKDIESIKLLFKIFPHSVFSQKAINGLTSETNRSTDLYAFECVVLLIAALDLDLETIRDNQEEKKFGLTIAKQYSACGVRPIPDWISNLHTEMDLSSKENLYQLLSERTGEPCDNIRRRLKDWQKTDLDKTTQPTASKINDLLFGLNPDLSVDDFISEHIKFIIRSIVGDFTYIKSSPGNELDFDGIYTRSREYLLKKWPAQ